MSKRALAGGYGPAQKDGRKRPAREAPQTPLDFALTFMRDETQTPALRAGMAKAALPYLHTRGEAPEDNDAPEREPMSDLELARRIAHILERGKEQQEREAALVPGAAQRETVRRRTGTVTDTNVGTVPDQQCTAKTRCTASGTSATREAPAQRAEADERAQRNDPFDPHPGYRWI